MDLNFQEQKTEHFYLIPLKLYSKGNTKNIKSRIPKSPNQSSSSAENKYAKKVVMEING
jgi:hypothetical protein